MLTHLRATLADLEVNRDQIKASHSCSRSLRGKWRKPEPIPMAKIAPCRFNILSAIINRVAPLVSSSLKLPARFLSSVGAPCANWAND